MQIRRISFPLFACAMSSILGGCAFEASEPLEADPNLLAELHRGGAVYQYDSPVNLSGSAAPSSVVNVEIDGIKHQTQSDEAGTWSLELDPLPMGGPYKIEISSANSAFEDVIYSGFTWLCSGQSNMFWPVRDSEFPPNFDLSTERPGLRLLTVNRRLPGDDTELTAGWVAATSENIEAFSAVCFSFGLQMRESLNAPVGLVQSAWGGTRVQAWTSSATDSQQIHFETELSQLNSVMESLGDALEVWRSDVDRWWIENDIGSQDQGAWYQPDFDDSNWADAIVPVYWENANLPDFDGVVWYRTSFDLADIPSSLLINLGKIDDQDAVWVNGEFVGGKNEHFEIREYSVPVSSLRLENNTIAVRIRDRGGWGGIYGDQPKVILDAGTASEYSAALPGRWRFQVSGKQSELGPFPVRPVNKNTPTVLFDAMIRPLRQIAFSGVVWYQGESNERRPEIYEDQLRDMIDDWRSYFDTDLKFSIIELAGYDTSHRSVADDAWPRIRAAQRAVAGADQSAVLATAIDLGEKNDIHPLDKHTVGVRAARAVLNQFYETSFDVSTPSVENVRSENGVIVLDFGDRAELAFDHQIGEALNSFQLCENSVCFAPDVQLVDGQFIHVSRSGVSSECPEVRYLWTDFSASFLKGPSGLPVAPFKISSCFE